ncbi:MAG: hypothetical protein RLY45_295 [Actinomycetota bacterium]|jgi:hypothetical protein
MIRRLLAIAGAALMAASVPLFAGVAEAAPAVLVSVVHDGPDEVEVGGTAVFELTATREFSSTNPLLQMSVVLGDGCDGVTISPLSVVFRFDEAGPATYTREFSVSGLASGVCTYSVVVQNLHGADEPHTGLEDGTITVGDPPPTSPPTTVGPSTSAPVTTVPVTTVPAIETSTTDAESGSVLPEAGDTSKDSTVVAMMMATLGGVAVALALRIKPA